MEPSQRASDGDTARPTWRRSPEARGERHASRAGATYARFIRNVADATQSTMPPAERYALAVVATLEERLPIREVCHLEAQLPSRFDELLAFQPVLGMPAMNKADFCWRVAERAGVGHEDGERLARAVFGVLRSRISDGESQHLEAQLSEDLKALWRQRA